MNKKRLIAIIMSIALILPVIPANVAMADTGEYVYKGETWKYGLGEAIGYNQGAYKTIGTTGNANWRDASASGNGELAFLESCDPNEDVFILTNTKIVQDTTSIYDAPNIASSMDIIRTTTINKTSYNWLNIINAYAQEQYGVNWGTTWPRPCHPGGQLRIKNNDYTSENAQIYNRYNNYETAEVGAQWKNADKTSEWERRSFVSRSDEVIVTQIEADQDLNITLSMDALTSIQGAPSSGIATSHILEADDNGYAMGFVGKYAIRNRIGTKNVEETRFSHGGWGTATRIVADGATFTEGTISGRPTLTITGAKSVMLITKVDRQDNGCDTVADVKEKCYDRLLGDIDAVVSKYKTKGKFTYEGLLAPHAAIHGAEFNKVRLDLCKTDAEKADRQLTNSELITKQSTEKSTFNKAYMERAYYTGRYALLCSSGYHTARLGGIWNGMWSPDWSGDFTLDANVNLQVSGMDTGNMPIADWGYMSLILRVLPDWAENAKNIYGADNAILSGPRTDGTGDANSFHFLGGYPQLFVNGITDWMLMPLYEYWSCYGNKPVPVNKDVHPEQIAAVLDLSAEDIARINSTGYFDFEKDILFPVLDKNMNFWMQFADERYYKDGNGVNHANDGTTLSEAIAAGDTNAKYIFAPGFSPENTPGGGNVCSFNVTMDVSAAKNSVYMATSVADAVYPGDPAIAAKKAQWADFGSKVPAYIYNDNGSLKEWLDPSLRDNNSHRHTSHAYAAWPGHEAMTDPVLAAGIQQALNDRYSYNATAPESHAHDHRALVEARLGNAEQLETPLRFLSNMTSSNSNYRYQSFLTSHNSNLSSGYVTDLACSYSGIINESLAYSYDGEIKILPALLKDLNKGSITGMMARCRAQIDELAWDMDARTASVTITSKEDNNAIKLMCGVPWKKASINGVAQTVKTDALGNAYIDLDLNNNETVKVDFALPKITVETVNPVNLTVQKGNAPVLPATVNVVYSDGSTGALPVIWNEIDPGSYAEVGSFTVQGTLENTELPAIANITVIPIIIGGGDVAWYRFDEESGAMAIDSARGNNATIIGATGTRAEGVFGNALGLASASGQYVRLREGIVSDLDDFTIALWVRPSTMDTWARIFDFGKDTNTNMFLTLRASTNNRPRFAIKVNGSAEQQLTSSSMTLSENTWYHMAITKSGNTATMYINGAVAATNTNMTFKPSDMGVTVNNWIGRSQWPDPYLNGRVDDLSIFSKALSAEEIKALTITSIPAVAVTTVSGVCPVLPEAVTVVYMNNSTAEVPVVWDEIDEGSYAQTGPGTFTVEGTITGSAVKAVANITVNRIPVWTPIEDKSVDENRTLTFTVEATDLDGDELTYSTGELPKGANFDAETQKFTWTPDYTQAGIYTVQFIASDDVLTANENITITVKNVSVSEQITGLKGAVAGMDIAGGIKNGLTVKLDQVLKLLENTKEDKSSETVKVLNGFIDQANDLRGEGVLTEEQAAGLIKAAKETILNIMS